MSNMLRIDTQNVLDYTETDTRNVLVKSSIIINTGLYGNWKFRKRINGRYTQRYRQ